MTRDEFEHLTLSDVILHGIEMYGICGASYIGGVYEYKLYNGEKFILLTEDNMKEFGLIRGLDYQFFKALPED